MKAIKILIFIMSILLMLGIISFTIPKEGIPFLGRTLYFPTIEDISLKKSEEHPIIEENLHIQQYQDSLYTDSLTFYTQFFKQSPQRIYCPEDDWNYFNDLFKSFDECKEKKTLIRILHYGDSQIESDRITSYLRKQLQEQFGGNGPGLLPAVQLVPSITVGQSASDSITPYIISGTFQRKISHQRYGVLGQVGIAKGVNSIFISTRNKNGIGESVKGFQKIRLFVGCTGEYFKANFISPSKNGLDNNKEVKNIDSIIKVFSWSTDTLIKKFTIQTFGRAEIYGIAVDGISGIAVDNIPFRGSSGTFFSTIDSTLLSSMFKELNVQLIILEFGGNIMPVVHNYKSVSTYKEKIKQQIIFLKKLCPKAKILFIGPADMSITINGHLQTYPYMETMIEALKEAALQNGAAFWDMYRVMGGKNSMIGWVKHSPSLAAPDYVHFNGKGVEKIAGIFYETLMMYYNYYTFCSKYEENKQSQSNRWETDFRQWEQQH